MAIDLAFLTSREKEGKAKVVESHLKCLKFSLRLTVFSLSKQVKLKSVKSLQCKNLAGMIHSHIILLLNV